MDLSNMRRVRLVPVFGIERDPFRLKLPSRPIAPALHGPLQRPVSRQWLTAFRVTRTTFLISFTSDKVYRNVDRTNVIYGSLLPEARNVYSTHGQLDPWRTMGTQVDINESSPTVIIPRMKKICFSDSILQWNSFLVESHCSDLGSISEYDSPEMRASKERIFELVQQWLGVSAPPAPAPTTTTSTATTAWNTLIRMWFAFSSIKPFQKANLITSLDFE